MQTSKMPYILIYKNGKCCFDCSNQGGIIYVYGSSSIDHKQLYTILSLFIKSVDNSHPKEIIPQLKFNNATVVTASNHTSKKSEEDRDDFVKIPPSTPNNKGFIGMIIREGVEKMSNRIRTLFS